MNKTKLLCIVATVLTVLLVILLLIAASITDADTDPTPQSTTVPTQPTGSSKPNESEPPVTEPTVTEPSVSEPPVTEPTQPPTTGSTEYSPDMDEMIGNLYTRGQLAAIDGTRKGYGAGYFYNGTRSPYALTAQKNHGDKYNAYFIAPDNGKIYFTFNNGYERNNLTARVLDILKEKNMKCVFFINMGYIKTAPELIRRMIDEGHIVANHATNHPDMGTLTVDQMVKEIMVLHNYMLEHFGYEMTLFRPPSGYYSPRVLAVAQSLGYTTVQWSYTYRDWDTAAPPDADAFLQSVVDCAHSGAIYQFHTVNESAVSILADAIDALRAKGYEMDQFTGEFE